MKVHELTPTVDPELGRKIFEFEFLFDYPLGDTQRFRIEHGPDFTAFFRAIGDAKTWVVQSGDDVVAALSSAIRTVNVGGRDHKVAYLGDLKIHPRTQILGTDNKNLQNAELDVRSRRQNKSSGSRIAQYLQRLVGHEVDWAYCVVMDGTKVTPDRYTGGRKFPKLRPVANLNVLRFETKPFEERPSVIGSSGDGIALYRLLCADAYCKFADIGLRSTIEPEWFVSEGRACGMLEDTRRAKRLYVDSGKELVSAHLSYFAFRDVTAARAVLERAMPESW